MTLLIEKNEKSGELMEVKEQANTVRQHPERMKELLLRVDQE